MVATLSIRDLLRRTKIIIRMLLLAILVFYVLPQLITLLWNATMVDPKGPDQHLLEKPLRVENRTFVPGEFS